MSQQNELAVSRSLVISSFPRGKPLICKKKPTGSFRFLLSSVLFLENASTSSFYALGPISISQQYQNYHMGWVAILWWPTTAGQGQSAKQGAICNLSGPHSTSVAESRGERQGSQLSSTSGPVGAGCSSLKLASRVCGPASRWKDKALGLRPYCP